MGRVATVTAFQDGDQRVSDAAFASWLQERAGKLTASRMKDAMDFKKDGMPSQKRSDYMRDLLAERLCDATTRHYVTPAMEWGLANEDAAKAFFTKRTGILLRPSRFYEHPTIDACGATPDGEIDHDGLGEVKCPTTSTYVGWLIAGVVPPEHKPQMTLQLACTGRRYVKFIAYDPRIKEEKKQMFVRDFEPPKSEIERVEEAAIKFCDELQALWEKFITTP